MKNPVRAKEVKKEIKKFKDKCFFCGRVATSYYEAKPYCQAHYPKPKKEARRGRRILMW